MDERKVFSKYYSGMRLNRIATQIQITTLTFRGLHLDASQHWFYNTFKCMKCKIQEINCTYYIFNVITVFK
jgi:hypothetical protein